MCAKPCSNKDLARFGEQK